MIIELGKTYLDRTGSICKVVEHTIESITRGTDEFFTYFPIENGKENRSRAFHVNKYGFHLGDGHIYDLVIEYKKPDPNPNTWIWGAPDKNGLWAYGGDREKISPVFSAVDIIFDHTTRKSSNCWRCYLGPVPEIKKPLVKEELWFCQFSPNGEWVKFWVPEGKYHSEEFNNCPNKHKTTTTRYV